MPSDWQSVLGGKSLPLGALDDAAKELLEHAGERKVWLLFGEMGSGKTTLIKAIANRLNVKETMSSPTFSIVNEYAAGIGHSIFHMDLYRLKSERELIDIGLDEYFGSKEFCFVEWPERLGRLTPEGTMQVRISPVDPHHRTIEYLPL